MAPRPLPCDRSERSRQLLTELMLRLLAGLAGSAEPNAAFRRFDRFLMGLPAGVQVFSLLYQNPWLLEIIAKIMGMAPSLSEYLSRHPEVSRILTHDSLRPIADSDDLVGDLAVNPPPPATMSIAWTSPVGGSPTDAFRSAFNYCVR